MVPPNRAHETRAAIGAHRHIAIYVTGATLRGLDGEAGSLAEFHRRTRTTVLARRTSAMRMLQGLSLRNGRGAYGTSRVNNALTSALLVQRIAEVMAGEMISSASHRGHASALVEDLKEYLTLHADQQIPLDALADRFYFCPMHGRLRVAGLVELGGLTAPATPRLVQKLTANAREISPNLGEPSRTWLGFRPSMPDSVPVIRPSRGGRDVILAFGHGHIGLTLAPRTARLVSALITS